MEKPTKPKETPPGHWYVALVSLVILVIFLFVRTNDLSAQLEMERGWRTNDHHFLYSQWVVVDAHREALRTMESIFANHLSVFTYANIEINSVDINDLTVQYRVSLAPRTFYDNVSVSLNIDGDLIEMQQSGASFSANFTRDIFTEKIEPTIIVNDGHSIASTQDHRIEIRNVRNAIFPQYEARFDGSSVIRGGILELDGRITSRPVWGTHEMPYAHFVSGEIMTILDDEVIDTIPIVNTSGTSWPYSISIDFEQGRFLIVVSMLDSIGLTHNFVAHEAGIRRVPGVPAIQNAHGDILWNR